jgi:type VI secretion system secreted protein VgrG
MVKIKGGATAEIASPMTTVKGDAMTVIKGGMVMIN